MPTPPSPKTTNLYNVILPAMAIQLGDPKATEARIERKRGRAKREKKKKKIKKEKNNW